MLSIFEERNVRMIWNKDCTEVWFSAIDVGEELGIVNIRNTLRNIDRTEKKKFKNEEISGVGVLYTRNFESPLNNYGEIFIPNPDQKKFIDHVNTIISDNRVENLRWCDYAENNNNPITKKKISISKSGENHPLYGKRHKRETIEKMKNSAKNIPIIQINKNGMVLNEWNSASEAERKTGIPHNNIAKCFHGERKTAGGYIWRHKI